MCWDGVSHATHSASYSEKMADLIAICYMPERDIPDHQKPWHHTDPVRFRTLPKMAAPAKAMKAMKAKAMKATCKKPARKVTKTLMKGK